MKIKQLYIRDFGIFNNQKMDEIGPGLVIIGGLNRAGKTTFLQLLRYLAFGFPRKKNFIPAREKHEVEAIVSLDNSKELNIHLKGYGEPLINILRGNNEIASAGEIYNNLDPFTYQQLFTITLDELQRNLNSNIDEERLQSILLGAGLQEFVLLPQIEDYFNKEAEKIGGKNGDPKVREFKPYFAQIEEGLNIRAEASRQVDKYKNKQDELKRINKKIKDNNVKKVELDKEITRLDILKNNYYNYKKVVEIESKIGTADAKKYLERSFYPDKAKDIMNRYNKKDGEINNHIIYLKEKTGLNNLNLFKEKCLRYSDEINLIKHTLSGLKERIRFYHEMESSIADDEDKLSISINKINEDWQGDISNLHNIKTDHIELVSLQNIIDKYNKNLSALEGEKEKLLKYKERKKYLDKYLKSMEISDPKKSLHSYFVGSFISIFIGFILSFIHIYLSIIGLAGFIGIVIYMFYKYTMEKGYLSYREQNYNELNILEHKIQSCKEKIESYGEIIIPVEKELKQYRVSLGLDADAPPELIKDYFREVQQCKDKLIDIERRKEDLKIDFEEIEKELKEIVETLKEFPEVLLLERIDKNLELYRQVDILFPMLEQIQEYTGSVSQLSIYENELANFEEELKKLYSLSSLELPRIDRELTIYIEEYLKDCGKKKGLQDLEGEKEQLIQQIKAVLNTELARKAMKNYPTEFVEEGKDKSLENLYSSFTHLYDQFISFDGVESSYYKKQEKSNILSAELRGLEEKKQVIKKELLDLSTDDKLKRGATLINQARQELSYLAEEYAVKKTAAYILKKVRETFIQQTKDKLLTGASQYFSKITAGEYKAVLPAEEIMRGDFQALLRDGTIQNSTELLSRGTNEQLFLAIRISRIREIEPALPVIVDDGFVNFDNYHLAETMELLKDLAKSHQVFILTCHSHLVELCEDNTPIQYWKLERGRLNKTKRKELLSHLNIDIE